MTKSFNILPNERIDVEDYTASTADLSSGLLKLFTDRIVTDAAARVIEGFRVEIPDQTLLPGQFTVHNGVAFDRSGQLLNNEDDINANRSVTLASNTTFYVEIQFTTSASDTDARGFWDPSFNNGVDPSGDSRPSGKEFFQAVATRITPDWTIVTPVSTTGFDIVTNGNSTKIPVAILTVSGGLIAGGSTVVARSVLRVDVLAGATAIKIVNTRIMPDAFTATIGAEAVTVTANDRVNGILTLSGGLAGPHLRGERLVVTSASTPQFLVQRSTPPLPTSGTQDARPRFWQGDEDEGYAYGQNPDAASGTSDVNVAKLKDYVDLISAQVREVKFGSQRTSDIGKLAPPQSFSATPRYHEPSGGLLGARTATITIGNGVTTWGDFNAINYSGDAGACIAAAYAALPVTGGSLYIKGGLTPYNFATKTVFGTVGKHLIIRGDGPTTHLIGFNVTPGVFEFQAGDATMFVMLDLTFTRDNSATGGATVAVTTGTVGPLVALNCNFEGFSVTSALGNSSYFENCVFSTSATTTPMGKAFSSTAANAGAIFTNCRFFIPVTVAGTDRLVTGTMGGAAFIGCQFFTSGSSLSILGVELLSSDNVTFDACIFSSTSVPQTLVSVTTGSNIKFFHCRTEDTQNNTFLVAGNVDGVVISDCYIENDGNNIAVQFLTADVNNRITIKNTTFSQVSGPVGGINPAIDFGAVNDGVIAGCFFRNSDIAVNLNGNCSSIVITDSIHDCPTSGRGHFGVHMVSEGVTYDKISITNCVFKGLSLVASFNAGIFATYASVINTVTRLNISNCTFHLIGQSTATNAAGILIDSTQVASGFVSNNIVDNIIGSNTIGDVCGIQITSAGVFFCALTVVSNTLTNIGLVTCRSAIGINVHQFTLLKVHSNNMTGIGHTSNALSACYGIAAGTSSSGVADVSGNSIANVVSDVATAGITINTGGSTWAVNNNVITHVGAGTNTWGIVSSAGPLNMITSGNMIDISLPTGSHYGIDLSALGSNKALIVGNFIHVGNANDINSGGGATVVNNLSY